MRLREQTASNVRRTRSGFFARYRKISTSKNFVRIHAFLTWMDVAKRGIPVGHAMPSASGRQNSRKNEKTEAIGVQDAGLRTKQGKCEWLFQGSFFERGWQCGSSLWLWG